MKRKVIVGLVALLIVGCNFFTTTSPAFQNNVSTEVSQQLTASPVVINTVASNTVGSNPTPTVSPPEIPKVTETETAIPTLTLTPTLSPDDPRLKLGAPSWKEEFSKANKNFYQFEDDQTRFIYESGNLSLTAKNPNGWMGWSLSYPKPKDFYLEATFKVGACSGLDQYGLVYRAPDINNGYFFGFSCDGQYSLRIYNQKGYLISWTSNPAILPGSNQVNRIGILALGDRYAFYANGKLLQETKEATFIDAGLFGAFIASASTSNFTVLMDEISYWNK